MLVRRVNDEDRRRAAERQRLHESEKQRLASWLGPQHAFASKAAVPSLTRPLLGKSATTLKSGARSDVEKSLAHLAGEEPRPHETAQTPAMALQHMAANARLLTRKLRADLDTLQKGMVGEQPPADVTPLSHGAMRWASQGGSVESIAPGVLPAVEVARAAARAAAYDTAREAATEAAVEAAQLAAREAARATAIDMIELVEQAAQEATQLKREQADARELHEEQTRALERTRDELAATQAEHAAALARVAEVTSASKSQAQAQEAEVAALRTELAVAKDVRDATLRLASKQVAEAASRAAAAQAVAAAEMTAAREAADELSATAAEQVEEARRRQAEATVDLQAVKAVIHTECAAAYTDTAQLTRTQGTHRAACGMHMSHVSVYATFVTRRSHTHITPISHPYHTHCARVQAA